ncbi:MAG: 1-(5-phosphoribosyl)-5-[(5-phosphoribosylamino)methylideneamino]imidazole-4-carboxamide isomerase [Epulopiscium sp.]|nr:1-(5-phosphoribosyl)-5-[(5-phosphoribosylamino)methylideneamino]imidazole-4-carboxamide isomerase [Candidatus Epulonipiscium sp.]
MRIYPAIDIKNGKCVRLKQGRFDEITIYNEHPLEVALKWVHCGASYLHLVDLDGALAGDSINHSVIKEITKNISVPIQVGGGIRSMAAIEKKLSLGIRRVILGTSAVQNPSFVKQAINEFGSEHIVVGVDAKDGKVAIEGWEKISSFSTVEKCLQMKEIGVDTIIYTDIARDGMLLGPNINTTKTLIEQTNMNIIASGGVTTMKDLEALQEIQVEGVIIGKALYQNRLQLPTVIEQFETR